VSGWIRDRWPLVSGCLLIIGGLALGFYSVVGAKEDHYGALACQDCHLAGGAVTTENAHQLVGSQEALCGGCHEKALLISHPSGFQPDRQIPVEYPLDWKGDVTCSSCHLVHGNSPMLMRGDKRGRELCLACHELGFFDRMADGGLSIQNGGHLGREELESAAMRLDAYSAHCISCHEDTVQTGGIGTRYTEYLMAHGLSTMKHPIGFSYGASSGRQYRPLGALDERLVLPEGKLSCVTCHQAYGEGHGKLVMSNRGSALCYQCHNI
jgi:predicted CXXCH cytochrome family protein